MRKRQIDLRFLKRAACITRNVSLITQEDPAYNKYKNEKVWYDGKEFDSIKERNRYITLMNKFKKGKITEPLCQVKFLCETEDQKICDYIADFVYHLIVKGVKGDLIVEDTKSVKTRTLAVYRLKKKLMKACHDIDIKEV